MGSETLRVREVAERLGVGYVDVFHLLSTGVLYGRPNRQGEMRVSTSSVEEYEASNTAPAG